MLVFYKKFKHETNTMEFGVALAIIDAKVLTTKYQTVTQAQSCQN